MNTIELVCLMFHKVEEEDVTHTQQKNSEEVLLVLGLAVLN